MLNLVIKNGTIYDGSANQAYKADIDIIKDKIVEVGNLKTYEVRDEIDASGLCILPGFIDTHAHSDMALLYDRQYANGLCQGITTELLGQGGSYIPLSLDNLKCMLNIMPG